MTEREYSHIAQLCREDLYRYAVRYTGDGDSAWDVVQDALVELWTHREDVESDKAKGYMIRVMYRELVDIHRHEVRFRERMPELAREQWYSQHDNFELHDAMQLALAQLPVQHLSILLMKDIDSYKYQTISLMTALE